MAATGGCGAWVSHVDAFRGHGPLLRLQIKQVLDVA